MSGEGVIPCDPDIPFGRCQAGRNPRPGTPPSTAARSLPRLPHSDVLPGEGGDGSVAPSSSSRPRHAGSPLESEAGFPTGARA